MSSAPVATPFTRNWTPATPMLSEAVALSVTVPETVAPPARGGHRNGGRGGIGRRSATDAVFMSVWISAAVKARL